MTPYPGVHGLLKVIEMVSTKAETQFQVFSLEQVCFPLSRAACLHLSSVLLSVSVHASHHEGPGTACTLQHPSCSRWDTPVGMGRWHWGCQQLQCNMTNPVMELCTDQGQPCNRVGCSVGSQRNVSDKQKGPACLSVHVGENKWLTRGRK